ncbi:MAG: glucose 1-dehydrogenase [Thermoplasmataceae archaeon]
MVTVKSITTPAPSGGVSFEQTQYDEDEFPVILQPLFTGICGTDRGIVNASLQFAYPQHGSKKLVLGHESIAKVVKVRDSNFGLKVGDLVVPQVRRPGKCINCLIGRSDNCSDGDKHEAGITGLDGFMRESFGDFPQFLVPVKDPSLSELGVLTEPLKNVEKAFEVFDTVSRRSIFQNASGTFEGKRAMIIGTGSEAFLYALKCMDYGFETTLANRHDLDPLKEEIIDRVSLRFLNYNAPHDSDLERSDLIIDTSGDPATIFRFLRKMNNNAHLILFGTNGKAPPSPLDGSDIDYIIERNITVSGSVDGSRIHYEKAIQDLSRWRAQYSGVLEKMITGKIRPDQTDIFTKKPKEEIKTVIDWR